MQSWQDLFSEFATFSTFLIVTYQTVSILRRGHAEYVQVIVYAASLAFWATLLVATWANHVGALATDGTPQGPTGAYLQTIVEAMLDLATDVMVVLTIVSIVIVPQFIAYVVAGIFGCASRLRLVDNAMVFLAWCLAKSFASISGLFIALAIFQFVHGWRAWLTFPASHKFVAGLCALTLAPIMVLWRAQAPSAWHRLRQKHQWAEKFSQWATRHVCA